MLGGVLAWLSGFAANLFSNDVVQFIALKVVLYTLFVTILPIVLNNVFKSIIDGMISIANSATVGGGAPSMVIEFTGAAAALIQIVGLPFAFSVIIAACAFKLTLRMIPFLRL